MKLYFAPLEGITTYTYRNVHKKLFGGCDAYYAPFITPSENERLTNKSLRDILPSNNGDNVIVPQIVANNAEVFLGFIRKLKNIGYNNININCGCPSGTVVKKNRGAGILRDTKMLDNFFSGIFEPCESCGIKISVKTRIGFSSPEEMKELMRIYNKYPVSQLTVHPRTRADFYHGSPNMAAFADAYNSSLMEVCYNGNVFSCADFKKIYDSFPKLEGVMIGRGAVANPAIFREIKGGDALKTEELTEFTERLIEGYQALFGSEVYTLNKLKEIWLYIMMNFPNEKKALKTVRKTNSLSELMQTIKGLPALDEHRSAELPFLSRSF